MTELPDDLYKELINVLADLDEFENINTLRKLFFEINPEWKNHLQDTGTSKIARARTNLDWILNNRQSNTPSNEGIVLLLEKLLEKRVPNPPPYEKDSNTINYQEINDPSFHTLNKLCEATKRHFKKKEQERITKEQAEAAEKQLRDNHLNFIGNCFEQLEEKDIIILCYDYYPKIYASLTPAHADKKKMLQDRLTDLAKKDPNQLKQLVKLLEQHSKINKSNTPQNTSSTSWGWIIGFIVFMMFASISGKQPNTPTQANNTPTPLNVVLIVSTNTPTPVKPTSTPTPLNNELTSSNSFSKFQKCSPNCPDESLPRLTLKIGENLEKINFNRANLSEAILKEVNLSRAYLQGTNLNCADLSGANLVGAKLELASLNGANLIRANLTNAILTGVYYNNNTKWPTDFDPEAAGAKQRGTDTTCNSTLKSPTSPQ